MRATSIDPSCPGFEQDRGSDVPISCLMKRRLHLLIPLILAVVGCGSPTAPDPRYPPAVGQPARINFLYCKYGQSATCAAQAEWGDSPYDTFRDVTALASWSSDPSNVVTVVGPGMFLAGASPGDAVVTVTYQGRIATGSFRVYPGESLPWRFWPNAYSYLDVSDGNGQSIAGARAEVISVHNQGITAVSNPQGTVEFHSLVDGPMTVRVSKAGYADWIGSWFMGVDFIPRATLTPQ
jgi:hypothetical protein